MFDQRDADDTVMMAVLTTPASWVGLAVVIVVAVAAYHCAYSNQQECKAMQCPSGEPRLIDHECLCVAPAR